MARPRRRSGPSPRRRPREGAGDEGSCGRRTRPRSRVSLSASRRRGAGPSRCNSRIRRSSWAGWAGPSRSATSSSSATVGCRSMAARAVLDKLPVLRQAAEAAGRDPATIELGVFGVPGDAAVIDHVPRGRLRPLRPRRCRRRGATTCGVCSMPGVRRPSSSTPRLDLPPGSNLYGAGMGSYTIGQVAERSGFSATALRYYEGIGLVPPAGRSDAGYRLYDDRTLSRLAFITRAKQLGCSLEEITDLVEVWDGERCAPVQRRLHELITTKLHDAHRQLTELAVFTGQLRAAAAALAGEPVDGPCDDGCACLGEQSVRTPVALGASEDPPIACTLDAGEMPDRLTEWDRLLRPTRSGERRCRRAGGASSSTRASRWAHSPDWWSPSRRAARSSGSRSPSTAEVSPSRSTPPPTRSIWSRICSGTRDEVRRRGRPRRGGVRQGVTTSQSGGSRRAPRRDRPGPRRRQRSRRARPTIVWCGA